MDVRERLSSPGAAGPPPEPDEARQVYRRGRRRLVRRRAAGGAGTLAAILLVVVAWPGAGQTGTPVIDEVADTPTEMPAEDPAEDPTEAPTEAPSDPATDDPADPPEPDPTDGADGAGSDATEPVAPEPVAPGGEDEAGDTSDPAPVDGVPTLSGEASTDDREEPPSGPSDLILTDVRVGVHDGFDRVVLEFEGDGEVGWFTELGDEALEDGSGTEVEVAGDAVLTVWANMLAFPPELPADAPRWEGRTIPAPAGAGVLTEVVDGIWFEGQQQVFLGLDAEVPYRMARLADPQRIVIDLVHP
jgi:hypothetical protein